jgi:hypothetical protein
MSGECGTAHVGDKRGEYRALVGRPMGKTPLGKLRYRWEDKTKIDLQEVELGDKDWTDLSQDRNKQRELVQAVMNLRVT